MDELACFAPGMLALGSSGYPPDKAAEILSLAEKVRYLIVDSYRACFHFLQILQINSNLGV